jgi:hypothetical protein
VTDRERTRFAAVEALVGASMAIGGLLLVGRPGALSVVGVALLVFAVVALGQSIAVGVGLIDPGPPERKRGRS